MGQRKFRYRLGLDLGTNSIGWCIYHLSAEDQIDKVVRAGVRIFSEGRDPQSRASLAADRRLARSMRRRRDRFLARRRKLLNALVRFGLLPVDEAARRALVAVDPYEVRRKALDNPVPIHHLGRAIFHLNQRRGFKSNRRVDRSAQAERGMIAVATSATRDAMKKDGARTFGEWLALRHEKRQPVRARKSGRGRAERYELYATRDMIGEEFEALIAAQRQHYPTILTNEAVATLRDAVFRQRPLKPVKPGKCTLDPTDERAPLALPSVQRFRIYQEVNNLRVLGADLSEASLTLAQQRKLTEKLERTGRVVFDSVRRMLKVDGRFNLESEKRKDLKGNATSITLSKGSRFGERWASFDEKLQDEIVDQLLAVESDEELVRWLQDRTGVAEEQAREIANAGLPDGYGRIGRRVIARVLPELRREVVTYDEAVQRAGLVSHSQFGDGEVLPKLPYYGERLSRHVMNDSGVPEDPVEKRYGRISNPTVHIALNQVRYVVNGIIDRYGHPTEIVVETARELPVGAKGRSDIETEQAENQARNDAIRVKLEELGQAVNGENITRLKLWEELSESVTDRRCPYTGTQISPSMLFTEAIEIDHLLPFSRTLDDSLANKVVCVRQANRDKGNSTPYEAFGPEGHHRTGYNWDEILQRATSLGRGRASRFAPDGLSRLLRGQDFLARQLNDTRYISRIALEYLSAICPENKISVVPGRLTALLRGKWGLNGILSTTNRKERDDHRHHAVDAAVVGATDRWMLQQLSRASERAGTLGLARLVEQMPQPWPTFRPDLEASIEKIIVSHRPDHSPLKQLHNETAYGIHAGPDARGTHTVVHRKPLVDLQPGDLDKVAVLDSSLGERLRGATQGKTGAAFRDALATFGESHRVRRVRLAETLTVIPIRDRRDNTTVYKAYKGDSNYCAEIFRGESGKWRSDVISTFQACRLEAANPDQFRQRNVAFNGAPLVMRLRRDDLLALEETPGERRIFRVAVISSGGTLSLCEHFEANVDQRNRQKSFKYTYKTAGSLQSSRARCVTLDPLGWVIDRGFAP